MISRPRTVIYNEYENIFEIAFYRDDCYHLDSTFRGVAEVITAKQRNGPTGVDVLSFGGETLLFGNIDLHREEY